ncbi:8420_t:CDS:2 [Entrophospora sp. SA101]|nr:8420_t:CDS:2 [Entrophospora sp. SA101]CAJ0824268.1 13117_t:CDS:2 [Entrophospora sp. SA101]CAJ0830574.1 11654_t:CDS:2 [Entrophospora sp. SA101]
MPTLYSYYRSSCSWRVRTSLNWKEIDYDIIPINLLKEEHKSIEYTNLNPLQEVPTFISSDGKVLTQSIAILEYLEEVYPQKPLLPSNDPYEKSLVRSLVQMIASDTQPIQNLRVLNYVGKDKKLEWAEHWITVNFQGIERQLSLTSKDYCVGNKVTLADICLEPQVYNANRYNVDMTKFPTIQKIVNNLNKLEEFRKSHPNNQVDCPENMKFK